MRVLVNETPEIVLRALYLIHRDTHSDEGFSPEEIFKYLEEKGLLSGPYGLEGIRKDLITLKFLRMVKECPGEKWKPSETGADFADSLYFAHEDQGVKQTLQTLNIKRR